MNLSELLNKGLVEKFQSDQEQIRNEMEIAGSDLTSAKNMLEIEEWGWAHNAAYNSMLQTGRAHVRKRIQAKGARTPCGSDIIRASGVFSQDSAASPADIRQGAKAEERVSLRPSRINIRNAGAKPRRTG
ncbi:MAG: hypothetical protein M1503_08815 [Thaumarchaeota archaeon]|nr:hypothetical protein [Nitrososphaerota archaeon]